MSALAELVRSNRRELVRDPKTAITTLVFPLFFIAMLVGISALTGGSNYRVAVVGPQAGQLAEQLHTDARWSVSMPEESPVLSGTSFTDVDAVVQAGSGEGVTAVVNPSKFGAANPLRSDLERAGFASDQIRVVSTDGSPPYDPLTAVLPTALLLCLLTMALFGTALPIITARRNGVLRLLGTTPLRRSTYVLGQAPARMAVLGAELLVLAGIALACGLIGVGSAARVLVTGALGTIAMFALAYLLASRMRNPDVASGIFGVLVPVVLFLSGSMVPTSILPPVFETVIRANPLTYLVDALTADLTGRPSVYGLAVDWAVLSGTAVVAILLAFRLFSWDDGDPR